MQISLMHHHDSSSCTTIFNNNCCCAMPCYGSNKCYSFFPALLQQLSISPQNLYVQRKKTLFTKWDDSLFGENGKAKGNSGWKLKERRRTDFHLDLSSDKRINRASDSFLLRRAQELITLAIWPITIAQKI